MGLKTPVLNRVEVDMVPLIDIISLLLMFLVMVGDMTRTASAVKMKLPRASEAVPDRKAATEGRLVVQLQKKDCRYWAVVQNNCYELTEGGRNGTLLKYLQEQVGRAAARTGLPATAENVMPVKLRIPRQAPMREVERVVMALAQARVSHVQYAADNSPDKGE